MTRLFFVLLFIFFGLCLDLGCGQSSGGDPKESRKVVLKIHAWEGYVREYEEAFKKHMKDEHNIDVDIAFTITTGLDSFVKATKEQKVHLVSPANDLLVPLAREHLIRPLDRARIPKFNQINPVVLAKKSTEINSELYAVPFNYGPYAIAYNKDVVPRPDSYKVLWDPKYRKRISISGFYDTINIYMAALMLGFPKESLFNLNDEQLEKVEGKLRELCSEQVSVFWEENLDPEKRHQFDLGMDWGIGVKQINEKYKGNWDSVIPKEGVTGWVDTWAMTVNVKDPLTEETAYAYMDFMIAPKVQAQMARTTSYAPVNPYAGRYLDAHEKEKYYLVDPNFIEKFTLWQPLEEDVLKKYQTVWRNAKEGISQNQSPEKQ